MPGLLRFGMRLSNGRTSRSSRVAPSLAHVEALSQKIREIGWKDLALAEALAESNRYLASQINTPAAWAYATRSTAQVLHMMRRCAEAQPFFEQAVKLFSEAGLKPEAGRTIVTVMENLMYLGRYEEALGLLNLPVPPWKRLGTRAIWLSSKFHWEISTIVCDGMSNPWSITSGPIPGISIPTLLRRSGWVARTS